jgi:hypothetical protein
MTRQLRPLDLGEILDRTAELYRTRFALFAGISVIFAGAMLLVQMLHLGALALIGYPVVRPRLEWLVAVFAVLLILVILLLAGLQVAAICRAVAWLQLDEPVTVRAATRSVLPRVGRYLWVVTNAGLRAWSPLAVLYIAFFVLILAFLPHGFLTNPAMTQNPRAMSPTAMMEFGLGAVVLAPLFLGALVYGVLMSLRYSLAIPASVVEGLPARQAIKKSVELSKGARGRIFVLALLVYVVRLILGIVFGMPLIIYSLRHLGHALPLWMLAIQQLAAFVTNMLIGPIYSTGITLFYYDQRVRKEGFDLEWMMRSAGLTHLAESESAQLPELARPAESLSGQS